ncbi:MAG TPA: dihydroorotate dehydrogenase 2 [Actinomycetota bacterium]|nr:dihydroorotate dehydrogenase 2 [Actinomycetota bacterium]
MATRRVRWFPAIGRPVFFAMPPEAAHQVAMSLLALPAPWTRLGGAHPGDRLETDLAGLRLRNPIGLAAGFDKACRHLGTLGAIGFGYVVGGTVTRAARSGNDSPRIARSPRQRSMVNAMGLPNPGAEAVAATLRDRARGPAPRLVSIADEALDDAVSSFELLEPLVDGVELNASCPNVSWGRDRDDEAHLRALVSAFRERSSKPLFVKLPFFETDTEREVVMALVGIAGDAGADGLTCSNTRGVADRRLAAGRGGLSGRALWPHTPRIVAEVRAAAVDGTAVNACGGVFTAGDVATCLDAGATTVQVYTSLIYGGPGVVGELTSGLSERSSTARLR